MKNTSMSPVAIGQEHGRRAGLRPFGQPVDSAQQESHPHGVLLFSSSSLSANRMILSQIIISEVVDISPGSLASSLLFIQPGISS